MTTQQEQTTERGDIEEDTDIKNTTTTTASTPELPAELIDRLVASVIESRSGHRPAPRRATMLRQSRTTVPIRGLPIAAKPRSRANAGSVCSSVETSLTMTDSRCHIRR